MKSRIRCLWGVLTLLSVSAAGCSGAADDAPETVPVIGTVTVDGTPIKGAGVSFRPDSDKANATEYIPAGTTDAEGKYELAATASVKGAPKGWYKVVVMPPSSPPGSDIVVEYPEYNPKYMRPGETDISVEVTEGTEESPQVIDIPLSK